VEIASDGPAVPLREVPRQDEAGNAAAPIERKARFLASEMLRERARRIGDSRAGREMMKTERRYLSERNHDHSPGQWLGPHALTWVRAPWGWMLVAVTPIEPGE
jgi:hypothetical protein